MYVFKYICLYACKYAHICIYVFITLCAVYILVCQSNRYYAYNYM